MMAEKWTKNEILEGDYNDGWNDAMDYCAPANRKREARIAELNVTIKEENRQIILLALAELSLRRPGWFDAIERIADKFGGREMFEGFRETSSDVISPVVHGSRSNAEASDPKIS